MRILHWSRKLEITVIISLIILGIAWIQTIPEMKKGLNQQPLTALLKTVTTVVNNITNTIKKKPILANDPNMINVWRLAMFKKETRAFETSGYRTAEENGKLYAAALIKYKDPTIAQKMVAPAGESMHQRIAGPGISVATDLGWPTRWWRNYAHKICIKYGIFFPYIWEIWHVEFRPNSTAACIAAQKYKIPTCLLLTMIYYESNWNQYARSSADCYGFAQVSRANIEKAGFTVQEFLDSPEIQFNLQASLLRSNFDRLTKAGYYPNDIKKRWLLSAAAYNAGISAVKKYKGIPPYKETQSYVRKISETLGKHW